MESFSIVQPRELSRSPDAQVIFGQFLTAGEIKDINSKVHRISSKLSSPLGFSGDYAKKTNLINVNPKNLNLIFHKPLKIGRLESNSLCLICSLDSG